MGLFSGNHLDLAILRRELQTTTAERDSLQRTVDQQTADIFNLQQAASAKSPDSQPIELTAITHALRGYLPSIPQAPSFYMLAKASDADSYAQALQLLLQHARMVGAHEVRRNA